MTTDRDPPKDEAGQNQGQGQAPAPFTRVPAIWGKPPPTTFRVGPLPKAADTSWAQPPAGMLRPTPPAPRPTGPVPSSLTPSRGILHGSMIPTARSVPPSPEPELTPVVEAPPTPVAPIDTTVRPLPPVPAARTPAPEPVQPTPVQPAPAQPAPAPPIPVVADRVFESEPSAAPEPAVAPVYARTAAGRKDGRAGLYVAVGVAALLTVAGGVWWVMRDAPPEPVAALPAETMSSLIVDATPVPVAVPPVEIEPAPDVDAGPAASTSRPTPAPVASSPTRAATPPSTARVPAATVRQPVVPDPDPTQAPAPAPTQAPSAPAIETQRLNLAPAGPQPTAAQPATPDPDAPIVTRPQPLN